MILGSEQASTICALPNFEGMIHTHLPVCVARLLKEYLSQVLILMTCLSTSRRWTGVRTHDPTSTGPIGALAAA